MSQKLEQKSNNVLAHFYRKEEFRVPGNRVTVDEEGVARLLFCGFPIARLDESSLFVGTSGVNTEGVVRKLNELKGVAVLLHDGKLLLQGKGWDGNWKRVSTKNELL